MTYAKTLAFTVAILATGASFAATIPEGSYPQTEQQSSAQGQSRAAVAAEAARWNLAGQPGQVKGEDRPQFVQSYGKSQLSRSSVIAEREAFASSGAMRIGNDA